MDEKTDLTTANAAAADSSAPAVDFPSEPFQCPACGQLLAPTCRVCVACKHPINPAEIVLTRTVVPVPTFAPREEAKPEPVRYPWPIFFAVLAFSFLLGLVYATTIYLGLLKEEQAQFVMRGAPVFVGIWVFFDALRRGVPGLYAGRWEPCSSLPSSCPGTWRAAESPNRRCHSSSRRWGRSLAFLSMPCWSSFWRACSSTS